MFSRCISNIMGSASLVLNYHTFRRTTIFTYKKYTTVNPPANDLPSILGLLINPSSKLALYSHTTTIYEVMLVEVYNLNNILAVATGISIVAAGCLIAYLFQKKLFNKYRDKVRNEIDKARSEPPVIPNKKA